MFPISAEYLGVILAISALWYEQRRSNREAATRTFAEYSDRYQKIITSLREKDSNDLWDERFSNVNSFSQSDLDKISMEIHDYMHLCSQQFHLYITGNLNPIIWDLWRREIENNLQTNILKLSWKSKERFLFKSYIEFHHYVETIQSSDTEDTENVAYKVRENYEKMNFPVKYAVSSTLKNLINCLKQFFFNALSK